MVGQINAKLSQGYSFVAIFRMIIDGYLYKEDDSNGAISRLETKKELYGHLINKMTKPRFGYNKVHGEKFHPLIEDQDSLVLHFTKDERAKEMSKALGISVGGISLRISFDEYCDTIAKLIGNYPELEDRFVELFNKLLMLTYCYFDSLRVEDTELREYKGELLGYVSYIKKRISNFEKQQKGNATDEAKEKRRIELEEEFGFDEGDFTLDEQIEFYKAYTKKSNQRYYDLDFLRFPINEILKTVNSRETDQFYLDLSELLIFLNPKLYLRSPAELVKLELDYKDHDDYMCRTAKKYFGKL
jgi:hypothetical protein